MQGPENNYQCWWLVLLCILGWLLQATRGTYVCLPQVGGQKRKPQIDGTYKVKNLHIQGEENLSYYLTHYHQIEFTTQHILITGHFNLHVYGVANENQFLCICNHLHVDLSPISFRFVTIYMQICCHLHVYLSLVSFRVVMIFLTICCYYQCHAKNGSQKLTAHFIVQCPYKVKNIL